MIYSACSSENPGFIGRKMQNLTAHYNIYFNAKELLKESDNKIKLANIENYNMLLNVYTVPNEKTSADELPSLNDVIKRANTIALEKSASTWVDDAYLLLAKAEYLKGNFYNASEYYNYITENYPKETKNILAALIGNSQTYMAMDMLTEADSVLKIASEIKSKYHQDALNATIAQSAINHSNYKEAATFLKQAIKLRKNKFDKIRWTFILAQLEENNGNANEAYKNYTKVVKSNASFELAFMANLYRIKVQEENNGTSFDKIATLKRLIKDDKNKEYIDQIYYQIGNAHLQKKNLKLALDNYKISANTNPGSDQQKGLSYLKLAELNFDSLKNYTDAQLYYDSTLKTLPEDFPHYGGIKKKASNLQYIATRVQIIDKQDELLNLASLSEEERTKKINNIISVKVKEERKKDSIANIELFPMLTATESKPKQATSFYFNNLSAISQGRSEFMNKWGRRSLTDNWRISSLVEMAQNSNKLPDPDGANEASNTLRELNVDSAKANYLREIPLTDVEKQQSNLKILTAFYELGNFYKDVLNDNAASIKTFEELIKRYPENIYAANTYYQLFRLYDGLDKSKSDEYKSYVLSRYPNTDYAKAILDPNFGKSKELKIAAINLFYKDVYDSYDKKEFSSVINKVSQAKGTFAADSSVKLPLQFDYINALAIGYTKSIKPFTTSLDYIVKRYPTDSTVIPRIKQQLIYIKDHQAIFDKRTYALIPLPFEDGYLPEQIRYVSKENPKPLEDEPIAPNKNNVSRAVDKSKRDKNKNKIIPPTLQKDSVAFNPTSSVKTTDKNGNPTLITDNNNSLKNPSAILKEIPLEKKAEVVVPGKINFETGIRQKQAIVVNIFNGSANIAKSFAGITQYFFSKFDPSTINVIIKDLEKGSKLVIIKGNFYRKEQALTTLEDFKIKLPSIMVIPEKDYSTFIISEQNLNLITSQNGLDQYLKYLKDEE